MQITKLNNKHVILKRVEKSASIMWLREHLRFDYRRNKWAFAIKGDRNWNLFPSAH